MFWKLHKWSETNAIALLVLSLIVVSIGGLVQIVPLFYLDNTIEKVEGMRPYSPLELAGRDIYVREGCYVCHSQMIRTMRDEVERYGHYSLAAESMYDHPFQWGSKRTGPDLARVGADRIAAVMRANRATGVPYTDEMIAAAAADFRTQANPDAGDVDALLASYPKAQARSFDGQPGISELDAVIAYLQMLGTLVDFSTFEPDASR